MILFESVTTSLLEVPNRVSLIFNLSKCPLRCKGCHSPELRQAIGEPLTVEVFQKYLQKYDGLVNCICFMGGDLRGDEDHFVQLLEVCQEKNIEVCIYTGLTEVFVPAKIKSLVRFLKVGPYSASRGGLESVETNQIFLDLYTGKKLNHLFRRA